MGKLNKIGMVSASYPELDQCWSEYKVLKRQAQCHALKALHLTDDAIELLKRGELKDWAQSPDFIKRAEKINGDRNVIEQKLSYLWPRLVDALIPAINGPESESHLWLLLLIKGHIPAVEKSRLIQASAIARELLSES